MSVSLDKVYEEALALPDESKAILAERIVEYLAKHISPDLERLHLDIVQRRKDEIREGQVKPVDAEIASILARKIIAK